MTDESSKCCICWIGDVTLHGYGCECVDAKVCDGCVRKMMEGGHDAECPFCRVKSVAVGRLIQQMRDEAGAEDEEVEEEADEVMEEEAAGAAGGGGVFEAAQHAREALDMVVGYYFMGEGEVTVESVISLASTFLDERAAWYEWLGQLELRYGRHEERLEAIRMAVQIDFLGELSAEQQLAHELIGSYFRGEAVVEVVVEAARGLLGEDGLEQIRRHWARSDQERLEHLLSCWES